MNQQHPEQPQEVHELNSTWCIWYTHRDPHIKAISQNYEEMMKLISSFSNVRDFWANYQHLKKPSDMPIVSDYIMFRKGIKPVWEDDFNVNGGKWIVRIKKGLVDRLWEQLVLAVIGTEFEMENEICGIVLSLRSHEDIISVWNHSSAPAITNRIKDYLKLVLNLPQETHLEYKPHKDAMRHLVHNTQQQSTATVS